MVQPLIIRGAQVWDGKGAVQRDLYTDGERIAAQPVPGALTVDLEGYTIFPGLINAHDHLELNHYPRSKFREKYNNAHEWGEDMNARLNDEPYKSLRAYPLDDRCFIGGLKNLLCGATTVAHHNPPHKCLFRKNFPVRVLKNYGWAHSLHFNTDEEIVQSYKSTPKDWPWFIHLAEGTDEVARQEFQQIEKILYNNLNVCFIHCVGASEDHINNTGFLMNCMVWCPSSNLYLLGKTADVNHWTIWTRVIIGSDSRLTADGDLLDEIRSAYQVYVEMYKNRFRDVGENSARHIVDMVTSDSTEVLFHKLTGNVLDSPADIIAIRQSENAPYQLCNSRRADLALVVKSGVPQIGDPEVMAKFPHIQTVGATLDGKPKAIHIDLARRIHQCSMKERGLEVEALPKRRFSLRP